MKRKKCWLFLFLVLLVIGCSKDEKETEETMKVGVWSDIVNFSNYDENTGKYYGLEIDVSSEIAKRLGYADVVYVPVKAEERDEKLEEQQVDCVIACYSATEGRREKFDLSTAYYRDCISALVQKSSMLTGVKNLRGAVVGVLKGTNTAETVEQWFRERGGSSDIDYIEYDSYRKMEYALEIGDIDAIIGDGCMLQQYVTEYRSLYSFEGLEQEYCVATGKESTLSKSVDKVIQEMQQDGTMNELLEKWN